MGQAAFQVCAAKAWLPPVVEQIVVAQHIVFAKRRVDLAKQGAESIQFFRLGELIENIAGQHQQVRMAGGDLLAQFRDAGMVHGRAGAGVDIADLHKAQSTIRQRFMRCQIIFCCTQRQGTAAAPPHDERGQQPRRYAVQPENTPNKLRRAAHPAHKQRNAGADAVKGNEMPRKHDAQAQRVAADVGQQRHQQQRQAVIQHRPRAHQLQRRQLQKVEVQQHIQRRLADTRQDKLKKGMIHGCYQLCVLILREICRLITGASGTPPPTNHPETRCRGAHCAPGELCIRAKLHGRTLFAPTAPY